MSWWPTQAQAQDVVVSNPIVYHTMRTPSAVTHTYAFKIGEGRYILHSACCVAGEIGTAILFIYSTRSNPTDYILREAGDLTVDFDFNTSLGGTVFRGPAWINFSATTGAATTVLLTVGLEKVKSQ